MREHKKNFSKRRWLWFLIVVFMIFILARVYYALTDDFRLANITYTMPYQQNWEILLPNSAEEQRIQEILNQPFRYIGKGAQSYAFASEDGRYVIKFIKFKHLRPSWFYDSLPSIGMLKTYKENLASRKKRKLYGVFNAYKLAYDVDRKESGLIYIQLNAENNPQRHVTLFDKIGLKHLVDLSHLPFILQERGVALRTILNDLLNRKEILLAQDRIGQIFDLYANEYQKGIYDHDHGVMQNTGFIGNVPIHFDVGKLVKEETMKQKAIAKQDAHLVAAKMKEWILKHHGEDYQPLAGFIDQKIQQLFD